jgi:thymidylate kinase
MSPDPRQVMVAIAVIGGDGAGKTTITSRLLDELPFPVRYLYMGIYTESSNVALPTSRLLEHLRAKKSAASSPSSGSSRHGARRRRSRLRATLRLANRIAEESYHQLHSWWYQVRGNCVLYDRHFFFDFFEDPDEGKSCLSDRVHLGFLRRVYPQPDLVIFLDAPPEVLYSRKPEASLEYLRKHREAILERGTTHDSFLRVDATRPLEEVYSEVRDRIEEFLVHRKGRTTAKNLAG